MDRQLVRDEMNRSRRQFHLLLDGASAEDLARPTEGTKWTNGQLLFHMLFGYLVVLRLLFLVRVFGRLSDGFSRAFAALLQAGRVPFHWINYIGSVVGARVVGYRRMDALFDRVIDKLLVRLDRDDDLALARGMHYPVAWDPYFSDYMTTADIYHYPTQHFEHHQRQLTLGPARGPAARGQQVPAP